MPQARHDKFAQKIARNRRNKQHRKHDRSLRRASGEISGMQEKSENLKDQVKSGAKEFGLLGLDIGKGVAREFGSLGVDFLVTFGTLGAVEPPYTGRGGSRKRRRR